jgi:Putative zinc-finger
VTYDDEDLDKIRELLSRGGDPEEAEEGHLSVLELTAFREGEVSSEEAQRIADHLASCPECSGLLREIKEFFQTPAMAAQQTTVNIGAAADWKKLRSRLDKEGWFRHRPVTWRRWVPAVAAVLTLAVVGFYFVAQPDWFGGDRPFTTLDSAGSVRGDDDFEVVPLSHDLILRTETDRRYEEYKAQFREVSTGEVVEAVSGLREDHPSEVPVRVPGSLEPGKYEILLQGIREGGEDSVGTYFVRFEDR